MATRLKNVLAIGVGGLPGWTPQQAQATIGLEREKAAKAGFELELYNIQLRQSEQEILDGVEQILKKRQWECVAFGFGIRGDRDNTTTFEKIVNMAIEKVQPTPKLAFPIMPDKIVDALERVLS